MMRDRVLEPEIYKEWNENPPKPCPEKACPGYVHRIPDSEEGRCDMCKGVFLWCKLQETVYREHP